MQQWQVSSEAGVRRGDIPGIEYAPGKIMVGKSPAMQRVFLLLKQYAPSSAPVLITGETGTGKELVAKAIHFHSGRTGPFIAVNCAGIPDSLFESEFFGHRRGAFTGAVADRPGLFGRAKDGTLFLDEIGEMPLGQQAKLLRVIDGDDVTPVGATRSVPVTARVVAATNRDIAAAVREGRFRADLLDRICTLCLRTPSLAERVGDLPELIRHFVELANAREGTQIAPPTRAQISWARGEVSGANLRQLRSAVVKLAVVKRRGAVTGAELVQALRDSPGRGAPPSSASSVTLSDHVHIQVDVPRRVAFSEILGEVEKEVARAFLAEAGGNVSEARRALAMSKDVWYRVARS